MRIEYLRSKDNRYPCIAGTTVMGEYHCSCGKTWEEAKTALLKKVDEFLSIEVPPPETVDVDVELYPWADKETEAKCQ
jgi:hypothetical protein